MCHWLGMLRPALVAHTDALGDGNAVRTNRSEVFPYRSLLQEKPGRREILVVQLSRRAVENSKVSRVQAATFQEGRDRMHTIGERRVQIPKTIEEKY